MPSFFFFFTDIELNKYIKVDSSQMDDDDVEGKGVGKGKRNIFI